MLYRAIAILAVVLAAEPSAAARTAWFERANLGEGKKSCADWIKHERNPVARREQHAWVLGYLTAEATRLSVAPDNAWNHADFSAEVNAVCAANSAYDLREAVRVIAIRHGLEPMPR